MPVLITNWAMFNGRSVVEIILPGGRVYKIVKPPVITVKPDQSVTCQKQAKVPGTTVEVTLDSVTKDGVTRTIEVPDTNLDQIKSESPPDVYDLSVREKLGNVGKGPASEKVRCYWIDKPNAARNISATAIGPDEIEVTWESPTGGQTPYLYDVEYRVAGAAAWKDTGQNVLATKELKQRITGLMTSTDYEVRVCSWPSYPYTNDLPHQSDWVTESVRTLDTVITASAPLGLEVARRSGDELVAAWLPPENMGSLPAWRYDVEYRPVGTTDWLDKGPNVTATNTYLNASITGLDANLKYEVRVCLMFWTGKTYYGAWVQATEKPFVSIGKVTGLTFLRQAATYVTIGWASPINMGYPAVRKYSIFYREDGETNWIKTALVTVGDKLEVKISGLKKGTRYRIGISSLGPIPNTTVWAFMWVRTHVGAPGKMVQLTTHIAPLTGYKFVAWLDFPASSIPVLGFDVEYKSGRNSVWYRAPRSPLSSNSRLYYGQVGVYQYRVRAFNNFGKGPWAYSN